MLPVSHSPPPEHELSFYAPGMLRFMYNSSAALQGKIFPTKYPAADSPMECHVLRKGPSWIGGKVGKDLSKILVCHLGIFFLLLGSGYYPDESYNEVYAEEVPRAPALDYRGKPPYFSGLDPP